VLLVLTLAACSTSASSEPSGQSGGELDQVATTTVVATTSSPPVTATTSTEAPSTTVASTTAPPTTVPATAPADPIQQIEIGRSVQGRPIVAIERGTPGGRRVMVVGVIHGDEAAGTAIVDRLMTAPVPPGVDLWLVPTMNPDGTALGRRGNANGVDLNRNFPYQWGPIAEPGDWQWAGPGPASEPETQAMVAFVSLLQPELAVWYHQDLYRISPGRGRDGELRARYAELTGLPLVSITGGTYTGVAATWTRRQVDGAVGFVVELGESLGAPEADTHALAVLDIAQR
jgi:protein MpaA